MVKLNKNRSENFLVFWVRGLDLSPGLRYIYIEITSAIIKNIIFYNYVFCLITFLQTSISSIIKQVIK